MIPHPSLHWNEILAAYADGELEGRDDLAVLRARVEAWLADNPGAQAELKDYRRLKQLWGATAPAAPSSSEWDRILHNLKLTPRGAPALRSSRTRQVVAFTATIAACVGFIALVGFFNFSKNEPAAPTNVEVANEIFSVASTHEVEILRVEGADTGTLVVGALPVHGPLELAGPGEVTVTSVAPDSSDNMVPVVRIQGRPMIWARLDSE